MRCPYDSAELSFRFGYPKKGQEPDRYFECPECGRFYVMNGDYVLNEKKGESMPQSRECDPDMYMPRTECETSHDGILKWAHAEIQRSQDDRDGLHRAVDDIRESLKANKAWLVGTLCAIIFILIGSFGGMALFGGFATKNEMSEVRGDIKAIVRTQETMSKTIDEIRQDQKRREQREHK